MPKKMLINALHAEEARVAIVEDGRLMDLGIEIAGREQTRGNVYKGVVVRIEQGLQAAFIDIGLKKLGFLQMGELHPDFWQWRDDIPEENRNRRPRIHEVLRRGQELLVQVEKGEREMKGAALTTFLSLPGRYMVLMPGSDSAGVSRKVEAEAERKKLKEMAAGLNIPSGIGYIIRTEALGKKQAELAKDLHYLVRLYESIREQAAQVKGPALIYKESDLIIRTIRDYFTSEIDEVLVDSSEVYEQAKAFFKEVMPRLAGRVKLHQEKRPIFSRYQLEEQIDQIYEKKVPLKSGGSLVIEPAEALVSIDVNSGKSTGERGVEDTAYKTNLEAAEEVARQLRLRDLGGLIVIDFIDMRDRKHNIEVEKVLKHALKSDKARVAVGKISQFGLLEMTRQRIRQTVNEAVYLECPHCEGQGRIKSVEAMALSFLRKVHAAAAKGTVGAVRGGLPLEIAYYLLNRKKRDLAQIENDYDIEVTVKGKPSFLMNQIELEIIKREKPAQDSQPECSPAPISARIFAMDSDEPEEEQAVVEAEPADETEALEGGKKRKRRRSRKKASPEAATIAGDAVSSEVEPVVMAGGDAGTEAFLQGDVSGGTVEAPSSAGQESGSSPRKRKRRRRRSKSGSADLFAADVAAEGSPAPEEDGTVTETTGAESEPGTTPPSEGNELGTEAAPSAEETKKKRRRRRRGGAKRRVDEGIASEAAGKAGEIPVAIVEPTEAVHTMTSVDQPVSAGERLGPEKKGRVPRRSKGVVALHEGMVPTEHPTSSPEAVTADSEPAPAKRKDSRRNQVAISSEGARDAGAPARNEKVEEKAPPKRKRSPRNVSIDDTKSAETAERPAVAAEEGGSVTAPPHRKRTTRKKSGAPLGEPER